ncbi:MAG: DUF397 domain-containing protein [Actinomycetota bacterium]
MHPSDVADQQGDQSPRRVSWRRSSKCLSGACVEVADVADMVGIRDGKDEQKAAIWVTLSAFDSFLDELIGLISPGTNEQIKAIKFVDGDMVFRSLNTGVELRFNAEEIRAFTDGVRAGEFRPSGLATA